MIDVLTPVLFSLLLFSHLVGSGCLAWQTSSVAWLLQVFYLLETDKATVRKKSCVVVIIRSVYLSPLTAAHAGSYDVFVFSQDVFLCSLLARSHCCFSWLMFLAQGPCRWNGSLATTNCFGAEENPTVAKQLKSEIYTAMVNVKCPNLCCFFSFSFFVDSVYPMFIFPVVPWLVLILSSGVCQVLWPSNQLTPVVDFLHSLDAV